MSRCCPWRPVHLRADLPLAFKWGRLDQRQRSSGIPGHRTHSRGMATKGRITRSIQGVPRGKGTPGSRQWGCSRSPVCLFLALLPVPCSLLTGLSPQSLDVGARAAAEGMWPGTPPLLQRQLRPAVPGGAINDHVAEGTVCHPHPAALTWGEVASLPGSKEEEEEPSSVRAGLQSWLLMGRIGGRNCEGPEGRRGLFPGKLPHRQHPCFRELGRCTDTVLSTDPGLRQQERTVL